MTNRQVAEAFADGAPRGTGSNMFIDGDTIYSYGYHFEIARKTGKNYGDRPIVLFNSNGYSVTTAKHKSHVYRALAQAGFYIIGVPGCNHFPKRIKELLQAKLTECEGKKNRARLDSQRQYWDNLVWKTRDEIGVVDAVLV